MSVSRRVFLAAAPSAALLLPLVREPQEPQPAGAPAALPAYFPSQDPDLVREMVGVSHANLPRVRELLALRPALANAAWDWGWGDWESALGAASHVGNVEIANALLAAGARPNIFSAAMLGQLDVVKAFVAASPGIQRTRGPHGITLHAHARAGGDRAAAVVAYLTTLGDADLADVSEPIADADRDACSGTYRYGPAPADAFQVAVHPRFGLQLKREGQSARRMVHLGERVFTMVGTPDVRVAFAAGNPAPSLTARDGDITLTAQRA